MLKLVQSVQVQVVLAQEELAIHSWHDWGIVNRVVILPPPQFSWFLLGALPGPFPAP